MAYPVWSDDVIITSDLLADTFPQYAFKLTNLDVVSTTTMAPDPDLQFELEENATYLVEFHLFGGGSSAAKFQGYWDLPLGATGERGVTGPQFAGTDDDPTNVRTTWNSDPEVPLAFGYRPDGGESLNHIHEEGRITTTASGLLTYRWGPNASTASITRLGRGSWGRLRRVA